jgi:hypothetical protein
VRPKAALNKYYNLLITVVKRMPFHTLFRFVDKQKAVNNFKKDPFYDESSEYWGSARGFKAEPDPAF